MASDGGYADFVEIHALRELFTCGDLVLVRASYLMELAASNTRLPCRQDLPDRGVCDAQMIERLLKELEELMNHSLIEAHFAAIVIVSYAWAAQEHPDPECQFLREVLAPAFEWYLSERAAYLQRGGFDGKCHIDFTEAWRRNHANKGWSEGRSLDDLDSVDFCVFLDFPSMYQRPRDPRQDEAFKRALNRMELLYGHQFTVKLRATRHLSSMQGLPYDERGWPFFETCVSSLISGCWHVFNLGNVDWSQPIQYPELLSDQPTGEHRRVTFDGTVKPVKELAKQASYHYREQTLGVAGLLTQGRPVPLLPEGFAKGVSTRKFTNEADHASVIEMHAKVCGRVVAAVTDLDFMRMGWSTEEQAVALAEVCLACPNLRKLRVFRNRLGPKGVVAFANVLAKGGLNALEHLDLDSTDCGDEGALAVCKLMRSGKLPRMRLLEVLRCQVGDAGIAAVKDMVGHCPGVHVWGMLNPGWDRQIQPLDDMDRAAPQPACEQAPPVVLIRRGESDGDTLVLEHASALARGERAPLTLASHPGLGIVPVWKEPQTFGKEWSCVLLGVGPAEKAIVASLQGEFLTRVCDGRVADIADWRYEAGNTVRMLRHAAVHPEMTCRRDGDSPGGRSFRVDADGNVVVLKEPSLVWGVKGPCTPAGFAAPLATSGASAPELRREPPGHTSGPGCEPVPRSVRPLGRLLCCWGCTRSSRRTHAAEQQP